AVKSFLLREFEEPDTTVWRDVPDPIGLGRDVYEVCARTIKNALPSVLAFVEQSELASASRGRGTSAYLMSDLPHRIQTGAGGSTSFPGLSGDLRSVDPEVFAAISAYEKRQLETIEFNASATLTS